MVDSRHWSSALEVRIAWMKLMGLDADEIDEHCQNSPPVDIDEEISQYNTMVEMAGRASCEPNHAALKRLAEECPPAQSWLDGDED